MNIFRKIAIATAATVFLNISCIAGNVNVSGTASATGTVSALNFSLIVSPTNNFVGNNSKLYFAIVQGNEVYFFSDTAGFSQYAGGLTTLTGSNPAEPPSVRIVTSAAEKINLVGNASGFVGANAFIGYGASINDVISNSRYAKIYTLTSDSINVNDYNTKDVKSLLTTAGDWIPNNATDPATGNGIPLANVFYSQVKLENNRNGLVLNGWSYNGWDNKIHYPVNVAIFEQNIDGTLSIATNKYLPDAATNGSGSVIVADFNDDGKQDIFLAAHNESPMIAKSSTAYLSNGSGIFTKIDIGDKIEAHHASLATLNGLPTVFVASFDGDPNPYYQYINGKFIQTKSVGYTGNLTQQGFNWSSFAGANSVAIADFNGDGFTDMVIGDLVSGPNYPFVQGKAGMGIYKLNDLYANTGKPELLLNPYFNGKAQYANIMSLIGLGQTHTYRVWTDDFNHDGKVDILAGGSLWSASVSNQNYDMLQMLQNSTANGIISFVDKTDELNASYEVISTPVDYSLQMLDIDNSGINTYMLAGSLWLPVDSNNQPQNSKQTNYILLNDGTGKLYIYMHDQFQNIGNQVYSYLNFTTTAQPRFIEYITQNNKINLMAEIATNSKLNGKNVSTHKFVNVPLQLDPTIDFKTNVVIQDRNGSKLIRTWAGDDVIAGGCSSVCSVDGGLGVNTIAFSGVRANYLITKTATGFTVKDNNGTDGTDNIKNIQLLKFTDATIELRTVQF